MATKRSLKMSSKRLKLRAHHWPDITEDDLWLRSETKGFTTIPRGLSLIMRIMDSLSPNKPLANTYMALWCYGFDEMTVTIQKPRQMALESGFTGQRAENTWRERMKKLEELGFIRTAKGFSGNFHYILILNPYCIAKNLYESEQYSVPEDLYSTLLERIEEVGEKTNMAIAPDEQSDTPNS